MSNQDIMDMYTDVISENTKLKTEIAELKASKKEAILSAHLAGQADAGVDPSYSNAQCYLNKVEKSDG